MIVRSSASNLDLTVRLYSTTVNFQYRVFPASEARVLSEAICISQNVYIGLVRTACSFWCAISNSRSSLAMLVLGRDVVHDRSTACARNACCKTFFSRDCKITKHDVHGVPAPIIKTKARITSTVLRYHSRLETVSVLVTARALIVLRIALFFSRDAASHSRRVVRL